MRKKANYHYYVEGEDEKSVLNALKRDLKCIESGKVEVFNSVQKGLTAARIRPLKMGTVVVLVYDTDVETNVEILRNNIAFLRKQSGIRDVICIPQVKNLEDELINACKIKNAEEVTKSASKSDYKKELINCSNLGARLCACQFDIAGFWSGIPRGKFEEFGNDAEKIKICQKGQKHN